MTIEPQSRAIAIPSVTKSVGSIEHWVSLYAGTPSGVFKIR